MLLPVDPVMSLIVVAGVFIYYAIKSIGSLPSDKWENIDFTKDSFSDIRRKIKEQKRDEKLYKKWLKEHQSVKS